MLILSRKLGETIQVGSNVVIKVTGIQGGRVQIGIEAPREVAIRRGDLQPLEGSRGGSPKSQDAA